MCGITGVLEFRDSSVTQEVVSRMADTLIHRGPDNKGVHVHPMKHLGFGFQRLSIIDPRSVGNQPMKSACSGNAMVFNGEIYNFKQLRSTLSENHAFQSNTDTEVLLHLYEELGYRVLDDIEGMFAFVLWDEKRQELFCARDHMGIKPLYYYNDGDRFVFGSEIKSILAYPKVARSMSEQGVADYLTFACVPAPATLFQSLYKLEAAHALVVTASGECKTWEYWNPVKKTRQLSEAESIERIRSLFSESVREQMVSDVPYGSFLSGGMDSTACSMFMSQARSNPVEVFSIGFEDFPDHNEFEYSRRAAQAIGSDPREFLVGKREFESFLSLYPKLMDDPNGDPVCFPLYYLSQQVRLAGFSMVQVGEGADEVFAGYLSYMLALKDFRSMRFSALLPAWARTPLKKCVNSLRKTRARHWTHTLERVEGGGDLFLGGAIAFHAEERHAIMSQEFIRSLSGYDPYVIIARHYAECDKLDPNADQLKRMTYLEFKIRLPELLLARIDKMTMANGLEARVPFLKKELVEFVFNLPQKLKAPREQSKYLFKKAMRGFIPDAIIDRKKKGFGAPIREFLRTDEFYYSCKDIVSSSIFVKEKYLNRKVVQELFEDHRMNRSDNSFKLWNLITLCLWQRYWVK